MQCALSLSERNVPFSITAALRTFGGIAEKGPTLVDLMHSKFFQTWWLLFHLVKIFENVAVGVDGFS